MIEAVSGFLSRRNGKKSSRSVRHLQIIRRFSLRELQTASNGFSWDNRIGSDSYATVYRGYLSEENVTIRRFTGNKKLEHFLTEMHALATLRHRNIMRCLGWCHESDQFLIVNEYMGNGTLYRQLFGYNEILPWHVRFRIALDIASAVLYMHEQCGDCILHRDINSRNIMLDNDYKAKITSFAHARFVDNNERESALIATDERYSALMGKEGFLDPEYMSTGVFTRGSDVYNFGIVILQLTTGQPAGDERAMVEMVRDSHKRGTIMEVADKRLNNAFDVEQMERLLIVGYRCTEPHSQQRPPLDEVLQFLEFGGLLPYAADGNEKLSETSRGIRRTKGSSSVFTLKPRGTIKKSSHGIVKESLQLWTGFRRFSYRELLTATYHFSSEMVIRKEADWTLYRGSLSGEDVCIKRFQSSTQNQYETEMKVLASIRHKNILRSFGWCHGKEKFHIIHEFMDKNTLYGQLHMFGEVLPWDVRFRISIDLASAILYMHKQSSHCILHRDIKSRNIQLDSNYNAKLTSFDLALSMDHHEEEISTNVIGTMGYFDPEYPIRGVFTRSSDMYSFGVVILEIATGQKAYRDCESLVDMVKDSQNRGEIMELIDVRLNGAFDMEQMERLLTVGLRCTAHRSQHRPSMAEVIQFLKFGDPMSIPEVLSPDTIPVASSLRTAMDSPLWIPRTKLNSPTSKHSQETSFDGGLIRTNDGLRIEELLDLKVPLDYNSSIPNPSKESLDTSIPSSFLSNVLTSSVESFDIGIPANYNSSVPMKDSHRQIFHGFLAVLSKTIESGARFNEVMEIVTKFTSTVVLLRAPLDSWNSIAQSLLRDMLKLENLRGRNPLVENPEGRTVGHIERNLQQCLSVIEKNDAELHESSLELASIQQEHASSMSRFTDLQNQVVEIQEQMKKVEETWDLPMDKVELLNRWRTQNIERIEYIESVISTLHESLLFNISSFRFDI